MAGGWCQQPDARETEYRRADLPPTLAQAMQVPEVKALAEAMQAANALLGSILALKNNHRVADAIHANRALIHKCNGNPS